MAKAGKKTYEPEIVEAEAGQRQAAAPTMDEIAVRAYHIYLERGETPGNPDEDWLQAERDLINLSN